MTTGRMDQPGDGSEFEVLRGWLDFHRDGLEHKVAGLSDEQLVTPSAPPSPLSLIGLVRHMTEMEWAYGVFAIEDGEFRAPYGTPENEDADIIGLTPEIVQSSLRRWRDERDALDVLLAGTTVESIAEGNGRSVRWNLVKLVQEYARHNGHADLIRERIDGAVGE